MTPTRGSYLQYCLVICIQLQQLWRSADDENGGDAAQKQGGAKATRRQSGRNKKRPLAEVLSDSSAAEEAPADWEAILAGYTALCSSVCARMSADAAAREAAQRAAQQAAGAAAGGRGSQTGKAAAKGGKGAAKGRAQGKARGKKTQREPSEPAEEDEGQATVSDVLPRGSLVALLDKAPSAAVCSSALVQLLHTCRGAWH